MTTSNGSPPVVVTSTAHLTPDGILGYAKGIAFVAGPVVAAVIHLLAPDSPLQSWLELAALIIAAISGIAVPNKVKPVVVLPAPPTATVTSPPLNPLLGVVDPPGRHEETAE